MYVRVFTSSGHFKSDIHSTINSFTELSSVYKRLCVTNTGFLRTASVLYPTALHTETVIVPATTNLPFLSIFTVISSVFCSYIYIWLYTSILQYSVILHS